MLRDVNPEKVRSILFAVSLKGLSGAANKQAFSFGQKQEVAEAKRILKIEVFPTALMTKSPEGLRNIPDAGLKNAYLELLTGTNEVLRSEIPVAKLIRSNGNSAIEPLNLVGLDPQKSKVIISDSTGCLETDVVIMEVTYEKK